MATSTRLMRVSVAVVLGLVLAAPSTVRADQGEGSTPAVAAVQAKVSAGGLHTCAVLSDGRVQCWGDNDQGQLGTGTVTTSSVPRTVPGISTAVAVATGNNHSCALLAGGTVQCWGLNGNGQVGDNLSPYDGMQAATPIFRLTPRTVVNLSGATAIATGGFHSCAVVTAGAVKCWGDDGIGQLGDGKPGDRSLSAQTVPGLTGVTALGLGEFHSCALLAAGTVTCWGHNGFGQLGDGTKTDRSAPVAVQGLPDPTLSSPGPAVALTAGYGHTCVLLKDGSARCWGANSFGQLGVATPVVGTTMSPSATPQVVRHNLNSPPSLLDPAPVLADETGLTAISAGQFHTCALRNDGGVRCWGQNGRGQLGTDPLPLTSKLDDSTYSVDVSGLPAASAVTAGGFHSCAVVASGMACWGYDFYGQLGSRAPSSAVPVPVTALTGARSVSAGTGFACALIDADTASKPVCWGDNSKGQLGADPTVTRSTLRLAVSGIPSATGLDAGNGHACAIPASTTVPRCWGDNATGQLGDGTTTGSAVPTTVSGLPDASSVSAGGGLSTAERGHTCAVTTAARARCWGRNASGQLGDSTADDRSLPVVVQNDIDPLTGDAHVTLAELTAVSAVSTGGLHSCALVADSTVWCWGANASGQLGDGSTTERRYAVHVQKDSSDLAHDNPLTGVTAVAAGGDDTCALLTGGKLVCWGGNGHGQLGDGSTSQRSLPTTVSGLDGSLPTAAATVVTTGDDHTCAVRQDGALLCWGNNSDGEIGNGAAGGDVTTPTSVVDLGPTNADVPVSARPVVKSVSASRRNTCVVLTDTVVRCWGDNSTDQLGDGIGPFSLSPRTVALAGGL